MSIVQHESQPWTERRPGARIQFISDPTGSVTGLALFNQECAPGVGAPSHTHDFEEILTILEGAAEVWIDTDQQVVGPGASVFIRAGAIHGFKNAGAEPLKLQATIASSELKATFL